MNAQTNKRTRGMKSAVALLLSLLALLQPFLARAGDVNSGQPMDHPMIKREINRVLGYQPMPEGMINILLLGFDNKKKAYSHTDTMIVLAINTREHRADLVSIPRDTLAYVPGTRGVYKLNGAVNVGGERAGKPARSPEGFAAVSDTISWILGGVPIHHYISVDLDALEAIGDEMGGIDFYVTMDYWGGGRHYRKGMQHLDGHGIVAYVQARTNATMQRGRDLARTGRQREMLTALFLKLLKNPKLLLSLLEGTSENPAIREGYFSDIKIADLPELLGITLSFAPTAGDDSADVFHSHVLKGSMRYAFDNWNISFLDQEHRKAVIREVFQIDVPELEYVSFRHANWLQNHGFTAIRAITASETMQASLDGHPLPAGENEELLKARDRFEQALLEARGLFLLAAYTMDKDDTRLMAAAAKELQKAANTLAPMVSYPEPGKKIIWRYAQSYDRDRLVNEVYVNFR